MQLPYHRDRFLQHNHIGDIGRDDQGAWLKARKGKALNLPSQEPDFATEPAGEGMQFQAAPLPKSFMVVCVLVHPTAAQSQLVSWILPHPLHPVS